MVKGYCSNCKKIVEWIKHADLDYYVCTIQGCNKRSKDPKKEKQPEINKNYYY
jgi:hypothetical protein